VQGLLERDRLVTRVRDLERDGEPGTDDDGADDREPVRPGRAARGGRVDEPQPDRDVVTVVLRAVDGPRRRPCEPVPGRVGPTGQRTEPREAHGDATADGRALVEAARPAQPQHRLPPRRPPCSHVCAVQVDLGPALGPVDAQHREATGTRTDPDGVGQRAHVVCSPGRRASIVSASATSRPAPGRASRTPTRSVISSTRTAPRPSGSPRRRGPAA